MGRDSGKSGAVGNDRAALPVAAPRRPVGAGETCAPRTRAGDRATPAGTVRAGLSVAKGMIPDESRMPEIGTSGSTSGGRKRDYAGD